MFSSIFFFITAFFLGRAVVKLTDLSFPKAILPIISLFLGTFNLTLSFFILGHLLPFTWVVLSTTLLVILLISLISLGSPRVYANEISALVTRFRQQKTPQKVFSLFIILLVSWLFLRALITNSEGALVAGDRLVWTDWPLHIGMASNFAWGNNFPPQNPTFAGILLIYPFFADFLSGVFLAMGASVPMAFAIPGVVLTLIFCFLFVIFTTEITSFFPTPPNPLLLREGIPPLAKRRLGGVGVGLIALFISLFWGGIGFVYWLMEAFGNPTQTVNQLLYPVREYSFWGEKGFWFFTFLFSEILPQRAFLFGLPIFFLVLLSLYYGWQKKSKQLFLFAGVLAGLSPFFHTHTFLSLWILSISVSVLGSAYYLVNKKSKPQAFDAIKYTFLYFVTFSLLSLLQLPLFMGSAGTIAFEFGWMKESENFFLFWFKNTGLFLPLLLLGLWKGTFSRPIKLLGLASLSLFIVPNLFRFAPWGYDNLKMFTYWYVLGSIFVAAALKYIAQKKPVGILIAVLLFVSLTLTGVVEVSRLLHTQRTQIRLWGEEDQQLAQKVRELTNPTGVFLTSAIHDHPVASLAGRKIVLGYPGNSWSWGIKGWDTREKDVHEMYRGSQETLALWQKYSIEYIVVGDRERYFEKTLNEAFIKSHAQLILEHGSTRVYKVTR